MRLPTLTGEFRLGQDPELRFTPSGKAVCSLSMIATESKKNDRGEWEDGESTPWIRVSLWDQAAEEAAEVFQKGDRVLATGMLYVRTFERRDGGGEGQSVELKWATVAPIPGGRARAQRTSQPSYGDDPWTTPSTSGNPRQNIPAGDPWGIPGGHPVNRQDEPPF